MRFGFVFILAAVALASGPAVAAMAESVTPACDMPSNLLTPAKPFPRTAAALAQNRLSILAIGSGSTVGRAGGTPGLGGSAAPTAYPYRMRAALHGLRPAVQIDLVVDGGRDLSAVDMLPILHAALMRMHFDLVLWQTGTVEAMRGGRPDQLAAALRHGAAEVKSAGADLVLIDPQFSRFLRANADLVPYEAAIRSVAIASGVPLFPRYDLTRLWAESEHLDPERVRQDARMQTMAVLNGCLGTALARFIVSGAAHG